jgi:NAD(P)-dependent dehydrogenase (short-subunit alcohol dehydrogenase family)
MADPLSGCTALVTGASRGIGEATVTALRRLGAEVVAASRHPFGQNAHADPGVHCLSMDVADWDSVRDGLAPILARFGRLDIVVNAAGIPGKRILTWELEPELFRQALAVNTLGPFHVMKMGLPGMVERGQGVVVNIVSGAAGRPRPTRAMYGTSKAALEHLTLAVSSEVADAGVRVYAFHPGMVDTELYRSTRTSPAEVREIERARSTGELQHPSHPAAAIAFLASPAGEALTDVVVPWRDPGRRALIAALPGFPRELMIR